MSPDDEQRVRDYLRTIPGYRQALRALVSAASKRREIAWSRIERNYGRRP